MKATKTEIIRLAQLVREDLASGHLSKNARQAVEVLADYQNAAIELLDLALEKATKEDKSLLDALGFLLGQSLEALRFDIESGYRTALDLPSSILVRSCAELSSICSNRPVRRMLIISILRISLVRLALSPNSYRRQVATRSRSILPWRRVRKACQTSTAACWPRHCCFPARQRPRRLRSAGCWTRRQLFGEPWRMRLWMPRAKA